MRRIFRFFTGIFIIILTIGGILGVIFSVFAPIKPAKIDKKG